jgi:hypothetical protein
MTKVLDASCINNVITIESLPVDGDILSEGIGESEGIALVDEDKVKYITSNASDLKDTIESLGSVIDQVITILSGLDAVTNSPGGQASNITTLGTLKTNLIAIKDVLK